MLDFQSLFVLLPIGSFVAGLTTTPHCAVMCGPLFVLFGEGGPAYQIGRVLGYTTLGALAGLFGASLNLAGSFLEIQQASLYAMASLFVLYGVYHLLPTDFRARFPGLSPTRFVIAAMGRLRKSDAVLNTRATGATGEGDKNAANISGSRTNMAPSRTALVSLAAGTLSALLPCGPLIPLWLLAAGSGNAGSGALLSGGFVLGTIPGAALIAWSGKHLTHFNSVYLRRFAGVALLIAGITMLGMRSAHTSENARPGESGPTCHTPEALFL